MIHWKGTSPVQTRSNHLLKQFCTGIKSHAPPSFSQTSATITVLIRTVLIICSSGFTKVILNDLLAAKSVSSSVLLFRRNVITEKQAPGQNNVAQVCNILQYRDGWKKAKTEHPRVGSHEIIEGIVSVPKTEPIIELGLSGPVKTESAKRWMERWGVSVDSVPLSWAGRNGGLNIDKMKIH
ncbi:hypothetical protein H6P81_007862 [Aristolochia fimbriata]|uniref:Uncharacterized protein n=1 Tax=Aristolochia fimbriata TaxID=158543 RepID=A0AAV7F1N4_ARIFI|nr:hypothetical protein H6P81_007862 [Aristolochia fimbriata]